jgi:hypothetical protein
MFGYIIEFCKRNFYKLTIFTNMSETIGWLDFYKRIFNDYEFTYTDINNYENLKDSFDVTFVTTDDDYLFKTEWINDKCISIDHLYQIRRSEYKYKIGTRPFITNFRDWVIPCYTAFTKQDKQNMQQSDITIAIIGGDNSYNYDTINRVHSINKINLLIMGRHAHYFNIDKINSTNINTTIYTNIDTNELFNLLKKCDYIFTDNMTNTVHINGSSMSGSIPIAFSSLTPLIISKINNCLYKFKNVIEFDILSNDKIILNKGDINIDLLIEERKNLMTMLDTYFISNNFLQINKNTALIVDPRDNANITYLINDFQQKLGDNWKIVFYCGINLKDKMKLSLHPDIEVREMNVSNLNLNEYSDFMKRKDLWESLYGDFVLTFQFDTYILNQLPYTIDYFISMNKSYIGGNMDHGWRELNRENIHTNYRNFNGGLSLRKRNDMIKIIDTFGTENTTDNSQKIQTDPEDVYFTLGCYKLNYPIGDTEQCQHFSINRIWFDKFFGIHKPIPYVLENLKEISEIYCKETNTFILKPKTET